MNDAPIIGYCGLETDWHPSIPIENRSMGDCLGTPMKIVQGYCGQPGRSFLVSDEVPEIQEASEAIRLGCFWVQNFLHSLFFIAVYYLPGRVLHCTRNFPFANYNICGD